MKTNMLEKLKITLYITLFTFIIFSSMYLIYTVDSEPNEYLQKMSMITVDMNQYDPITGKINAIPVDRDQLLLEANTN